MHTNMPIKHLVISGGGPLGLRYLGALEKTEKEGIWKIDDIESIYGTSIGSVIGAFVCLKYDWETLNKYIIDRPWHESFKITARQIFDSYHNKGLFDKKLAEIIFKPLLEAKDLNINITLQQFYEFSKIDFHIFTFDLNKFETVELSHNTHPDLGLLQALTMSSALPGIFMPTIIDNKCYIDGGVMCNYPLNQCLRDYNNKDEILGIRFLRDKGDGCFKNMEVNQESSLLEYIMCSTINSMNFIRDTVKIDNIDNTIICYIYENPLTLDFIRNMIKNKELRREWIQMGEEDAAVFIKQKLNTPSQIV
jgi:predicted acylesterase/phospholipase RssA